MIWNPKIIKVGKDLFQIGLMYDDKWTHGVAIAQDSTEKSVLYTFFGLWNKLGGIGNELKGMGFSIKHPILFNRKFREWLKTVEPMGTNIVKVYEVEKKEKKEWELLKNKHR